MMKKKLTVEQYAAQWRAKHGSSGIASELYRAVIAGEVEYPSRKGQS